MAAICFEPRREWPVLLGLIGRGIAFRNHLIPKNSVVIYSCEGVSPKQSLTLVGQASCLSLNDGQDARPTRNQDWTPDRSPIGANLMEREQMKSKGYKIPPNPPLPKGGTGKRLLTPLSKGGQGGFFEVRKP